MTLVRRALENTVNHAKESLVDALDALATPA
jgi:hypothetical protein